LVSVSRPAQWSGVSVVLSAAITAVIDRYLRLRLDAAVDRPDTVRHLRDALGRLLIWLAEAHPEITNLVELRREHSEEFLHWFGAQTNQLTGGPAAPKNPSDDHHPARRHRSVEWVDVPGRVLFTRADIPKMARTLPRFVPDHGAPRSGRPGWVVRRGAGRGGR